MANQRPPEPLTVREAIGAAAAWLLDDTVPAPARSDLAQAVRLTARGLAAVVPGSAVEVRIPPFVAVQCISGPRHRRGTPPNVVETDARTWLLVVTGLLAFEDAVQDGRIALSGARAREISACFPLVSIAP